MEKLCEAIQNICPDISMKEFRFIEVDYSSVMPDKVVHDEIVKLHGVRIWQRDDGKYEIQFHNHFTILDNEKDVISLVERSVRDVADEHQKMLDDEKRKKQVEQEVEIKLFKQNMGIDHLDDHTADWLISVMKED